jgi:Tol biopolymer transport system component
LSESLDLTWSPRPDILYQRQEDQNYYLLDPETEEETPLIENASEGSVSSTHFSQDQKKVAVYWDRQPHPGLWIISMEDSSQRLVKEGPYYPLGWSDDGEWIHAMEVKAGKEEYLTIELKSGRVRELPRIQFKIEGHTFQKVLNSKPEIFTVGKGISDAWMIEKFDREIK